jgi:hypothetical protein
MILAKRGRRLTPEEKDMGDNIRAIRRQIQCGMKGTALSEQFDYMGLLGWEALKKSGFLEKHPEWARQKHNKPV